MRSTLPLFPTDDGWPYPDANPRELIADAPDLDALEMLGPHAYDCLSDDERTILFAHFGLGGFAPRSMKELARELSCTRADAREVLGGAIDKLRVQLLRE